MEFEPVNVQVYDYVHPFVYPGFPQTRRSGNPISIRPMRYFEETIHQRADVTVHHKNMAEPQATSNMADQEQRNKMTDSPLIYFAVLVWVTAAFGILSEMPVPYWSLLVAVVALFMFRYLHL